MRAYSHIDDGKVRWLDKAEPKIDTASLIDRTEQHEWPEDSHRTEFLIRHSSIADIPRLHEIFATARKFMASTGNPNQWEEGYPSEEMLHNDIKNGDSYVCLKEGNIVGTFVLRAGEDPTYKVIDGAWLNDLPYATIHRIASSGEVKGIIRVVMQFARQHYRNIRIDTHRDNIVMQNALRKEGFTYCGIIHCWNGSDRLAYIFSQNTNKDKMK